MDNQPHEEQILYHRLRFIEGENAVKGFKKHILAINSAFAGACYVFSFVLDSFSGHAGLFVYGPFQFVLRVCCFISAVPSQALGQHLPDTPGQS